MTALARGGERKSDVAAELVRMGAITKFDFPGAVGDAIRGVIPGISEKANPAPADSNAPESDEG